MKEPNTNSLTYEKPAPGGEQNSPSPKNRLRIELISARYKTLVSRLLKPKIGGCRHGIFGESRTRLSLHTWP